MELKDYTIEEKAKRYDEALEAVKSLREVNPSDEGIQNWVNENFPELKENEGEKTRYEIIAFVEQSIHRGGGTPIPQEQEDRWIAWLEKQGDKDSQVKLPTFTFDDVLALQNCMETVKKVQEDKELYEQLQSLHDRVHDAYWIEKQGEQKPYDNATIVVHHDFAPKSAIEAAKEEKVDNTNKIEPKFKML